MTRRIRSEITICVAYATFGLNARHLLLDKFATVRPDVNVEISASEWTDEVLEKVKSGEADFGIAFGPLDDQNVETCPLEELQLALAVPKEHPLAGKLAIHLSDLTDVQIAITSKDPKMIRVAPRYSWLFDAGAVPVHVPEGRRYVFDAARQRRVCAMCYTNADQVPDDFVKIPLADALPPFTLILVRAKRIMSPSAERLWRLADEMSKEG